MPLFHPKSLLDKTYEIGIIIKGFDGTVELIGGFLVLFLSPNSINGIVRFLTQNSLQENPHGLISNHIVKIGADLNHGSHIFAAAFLLTHGLTKVVLVICLLLNKMWAYPWALVTLVIFLVYQIYLLAISPGFGMAFLTVLDAVIIYLVNREWNHQKLEATHKSSVAPKEA
jgi:uncharacterized membrane protein